MCEGHPRPWMFSWEQGPQEYASELLGKASKEGEDVDGGVEETENRGGAQTSDSPGGESGGGPGGALKVGRERSGTKTNLASSCQELALSLA